MLLKVRLSQGCQAPEVVPEVCIRKPRDSVWGWSIQGKPLRSDWGLLRQCQACAFYSLPLPCLGSRSSSSACLGTDSCPLDYYVLFPPVAALGPPPNGGTMDCHCHPCSSSNAVLSLALVEL